MVPHWVLRGRGADALVHACSQSRKTSSSSAIRSSTISACTVSYFVAVACSWQTKLQSELHWRPLQQTKHLRCAFCTTKFRCCLLLQLMLHTTASKLHIAGFPTEEHDLSPCISVLTAYDRLALEHAPESLLMVTSLPYGLAGEPDGSWTVDQPPEEVPSELPEPCLGVNFARDGMARRDWLALVAVHSDAWLLRRAAPAACKFYRG